MACDERRVRLVECEESVVHLIRGRSFQTDLNQLAEPADVKLPELNELLQRQITALGAYSGVSGPTRTCGADSAFFSLTGVLRQRAVRASQVIVATSEALHDIAEVYMRADGRTR